MALHHLLKKASVKGRCRGRIKSQIEEAGGSRQSSSDPSGVTELCTVTGWCAMRSGLFPVVNDRFEFWR